VLIAATLDASQKAYLSVEPDALDLSNAYANWSPQKWNLRKHLPLEGKLDTKTKSKLALSPSEITWIEAWNEFIEIITTNCGHNAIPGFPIWVDEFKTKSNLRIPKMTPDWKANFLTKNANFYTQHRKILDPWLKKWNRLSDFPPSRRKLEWQAQDAKNLWSTVMHFRPSGIRAKKPTYLPALVAITQTSILGDKKRRLSTREAARLQGLPDWFDFMDQPESLTYKQLGNAVNVGVIFNTLRAQVVRDLDLLKDSPNLTKTIISAPQNPDDILRMQSLLFDSSHRHRHTEENLGKKLTKSVRNH
jgi:DNA (cytosine-5)-methyltransferase 1